MNNGEYAGIVLQEFTHTLSSIDGAQAEKLVQLIDRANEVLCAGAGRSGFRVKGFAVHLMHTDMASYIVGETCTPNIKGGGVLVVCSENGGTKSLVNHAAKAKKVGARIALITIGPNSSVVNMAGAVIEINAPLPESAKQRDIKFVQPMGSLFEQSEGIFMDIAVMVLMKRRGKGSGTIFGRHANME